MLHIGSRVRIARNMIENQADAFIGSVGVITAIDHEEDFGLCSVKFEDHGEVKNLNFFYDELDPIVEPRLPSAQEPTLALPLHT